MGAVTRTLTINGALARHMMRQHLDLSGITYSEVKDDHMSRVESAFTFEASEAQWLEVQEYAKKVGW
jgi:hypothetical protein